ncbi:hypothetical protein M426DRAFT_325263 [Hypoxylon sp. CI-4A]|nr:hypothetical protein M426DRAFT_325263 [Hypoxylon sp. CI-4A]
MALKHLVLFQFKTGTSAEVVKEATSRMLGLKESCVSPTSQKPYIKSLTGGKDNSPEGFQNGITHAFVAEFESPDDREYYINKDPAHEEFKVFVVPLIEKLVVVDFFEGVF